MKTRNDGNDKKYLILGLSAVALVAIVLGFVAIADFHGDDPKVPPLTQVSASASSLCGIAIDGTNSPVVCYGLHTIEPEGNFRMVSQSNTHACAISTDNAVICWGTACTEGEPGCPAALTQLSQDTYWEVAVGEQTTCLLHQSDSKITCTGGFPVPGPVANMHLIDIAIDDNLACVVNAASQTFCWDNAGQLFNVSSIDGQGVLEASGGFSPSVFADSNARRRRRSADETAPIPTVCATSFNRQVWCQDLRPDQDGNTRPWIRVLADSTSQFEVVSFSAGRGCAVSTTGEIECFTFGIYIDPLPEQPEEFEFLKFTDVTVTGNTACALADDYKVFCWGDVKVLGAFKLPKLPRTAQEAAAASYVAQPPSDDDNATTAAPSAATQYNIPLYARQPCALGTRRVVDGSCEDINECTAGSHTCGRWSYCVNTDGSFECPCYPGYTKTASGACVDVDECTLGTHNCHDDATCVNWNGQYWCECNEGYEGTGVECVDVDECARDLHDCHAQATCNNTIGSFTCTCNEGWGGNGTYCGDLDECTLNTHACDANAFCNNTIGWYNCTCNDNYYGNGTFCDPDQCFFGTDSCDANAYCTDTIPGYNCTCNTGWEGDGFSCSDENECTTGSHNCDPNASCANTVGSFTCTCNTHYLGNGTYCDLDECAAGVDNCHAQATCTNTNPGFNCTCNTGWGGNGTYCGDLDECTLNTYTCRDNAYCNNTIGSYECPCLDYFEDDNVNCNDIDECTLNLDNCPMDSSCNNVDGFFECDCSSTAHNFSLPADPVSFIGLTRASGLPVFISVGQNETGYTAHMLWCDDHDCTAPTEFAVPELFEEEPVAAIRSDDSVVLAGRRVDSQVLLYRYCADVGCTTTNTVQIDSAGYGTGIAVDSNDDVIMMTSSLTTLKIVHCLTPECMWADRLVNETTTAQSRYLNMKLNDADLPVMSHLSSQYLGVFTCQDDLCQNITSSDYTETDDGFMNSMTIRSDGRPAVVWRSQDSGKLMFGSCTTPDCTTLDAKALTNGGYFPSIDLRPMDWLQPGDFPVITHLRSVTGTREVELITCLDPECDSIERFSLQATGHGAASGVFYNPISNYLYTMEEHGDIAEGWLLRKYCINH